MATGRSPADNYVKYEAKTLTWLVFGWAGITVVVVLMAVHIVFPLMNRKTNRVRAELKAMALIANLYNRENGAFPRSFEELEASAGRPSNENANELARRDPWGRDYYYFNISEERVAVASAGRNGKLDTEFDVLSAPAKNEIWKTDSESIFIYYAVQGDDWIYLAGAWPSKRQ